MDELEAKLLALEALVAQRTAMRRDMTDEEWDTWHAQRGWVKDEDGLLVHPGQMACVKEQFDV